MTAISTATWLIATAYVIAFLLLSVQAAKAANRSVWLFGEGTEDQRLPAFLFRLCFAGAVLGFPLMVAFGLSGGWRLFPVHEWQAVLGNLLAATGAAVALAAQAYMGRAWRIGAAEGQLGEFIDHGPFALSRNPVFVGQMLLFCGLATTMPDPLHLALPMLAIVAIRRQVAIEERVLAASLGEPYEAYRRRVRRFV